MITLPPGFDFSLLMSDYFYITLPFISLAVLFACYKIVNKVLRGY